jgi:hypothetical protein
LATAEREGALRSVRVIGDFMVSPLDHTTVRAPMPDGSDY